MSTLVFFFISFRLTCYLYGLGLGLGFMFDVQFVSRWQMNLIKFHDPQAYP